MTLTCMPVSDLLHPACTTTSTKQVLAANLGRFARTAFPNTLLGTMSGKG